MAPVGVPKVKGDILIDFDQLYRELRPELLTYFKRRLPAGASAEDFVQSTFERLLSKGNADTPRTLMFLIADGLLKNEYRDRERDPLARSFDDEREWRGVRDRTLAMQLALRGHEDHEHAAPDANHPGVEHLAAPSYDWEDSIFAGDFDRAVRVLEDEPRDAFILGELRGLTVRETGAILDISFATAARHERAATDTIRKELTA
jgi:RNA polymerase sigma factor (sigma-70 family)